MRVRVWNLRGGVDSVGFRVEGRDVLVQGWGPGFVVFGLKCEFRVQGFGFRVSGLGFGSSCFSVESSCFSV